MASSASETGAPGMPEPGVPDPAPIIGITAYQQPAAWGVWDTEAVILPAEYVRMVAVAGGVPVLLPPHGTDVAVLDRLDGLLLSGGADVGPERYGAEPHTATVSQEWRDAHEFALAAAAIDAGLPVLGICRGLQVINVALGGTLHQHLPEVLGHSDYQPAPGEYGEVTVTCAPGTMASALLGPETTAPCYHHQAVDRVAPGLQVTGRAADGTVEILEAAPAPEPDPAGQDPAAAVPGPATPGWLLAVQWHPEHDSQDARVVTGLVAAARAHATTPPASRGGS